MLGKHFASLPLVDVLTSALLLATPGSPEALLQHNERGAVRWSKGSRVAQSVRRWDEGQASEVGVSEAGSWHSG